MDRETVKFQALELRRRECKLCDRVREIYLKIAKKEFDYKSQIPYDSAPEFEVWMWEKLKGCEWPLNAASIDRIRYEAYGLIHRIKQKLQLRTREMLILVRKCMIMLFTMSPRTNQGRKSRQSYPSLSRLCSALPRIWLLLQHLVFFGVYRANKTVGEIAAETGKPVKTISNALNKANLRARVLVERAGTTWEVASGVLNDVDRSRM